MEGCIVITHLPCELISYILEDVNIAVSDIAHFSMVCKHLHHVVTSQNKLWRTKYFQRWPFMRDVYSDYVNSGNRITCWREQMEKSIKSRETMMYLLSLMSSKNYQEGGNKWDDLSHWELREFDPLFDSDHGAAPLAFEFLRCELLNLVNDPNIYENLTIKYYAQKVLRHMVQVQLTKEWENFISLPEQKQIMEKGAVLVAQWSQPTRKISCKEISSLLDKIAEQTKEELRGTCPNHPIFLTPAETFEYWRNNNIPDNQWDPSKSRKIMRALCSILFNELGFYVEREVYYILENSFIDRVLENRCGLPIILGIIFESVARRLGIRCEGVSFPSHFFLRWKENYSNVSKTEEAESLYIDVINGGKFLTKRHCPRVGAMIGGIECPVNKERHNAANVIEVVTRMANNLETAARQFPVRNGRAARLRSALELLHLVQPYDANHILQLTKFYMHHQMVLRDLEILTEKVIRKMDATTKEQAINILQLLEAYQQTRVPKPPVLPKKRTSEVLYAIGLTFRHMIRGYMCVTIGWDPYYEEQYTWMVDVDMEGLGLDDQPCYLVCEDNGILHYVAQELLLPAPTPSWINNFELGRYFEKFTGQYYVPNKETANLHPEDAQFISNLLSKDNNFNILTKASSSNE
ncbi:F-box only protein 21-like [Prorops nasuta]|uniref:F-box only protein 21-like n=1 Tax=Prorops nasuta TaxID=863751 RepID=UPI0034CD39C4